MRLVQAYGAEPRQRATFEAANDATLRARMRTVRLLMAYYPPIEFLQPVALAVVFLLGLWMVGRGAVQVGVLVSFVLLVQRLFEPIQQFAELTMVSQSAAASLTRITGFLDERPAVHDPSGAGDMPAGDGRIELRGVSFAYAADLPAVLRNVELHVPAGQRVAVIGESGAGKSTLARLLVRFHDPTSGAVLIDGMDLRNVSLASLRRTVALVPQEGFLFDGTVASNIAMVREGETRAGVERAMARGGILAALSALPQGLDTRVSGGGRNLSAGQRQLVALARALFADPRVVVLDEATSNLDPGTEAAVEEAMRAVLRGRTAVVIAHRVATALRADRVVLMEHGRVVEDGTPLELRRAATRFARWADREERSA
jgi:ATP-binding cassette, subfamily B, bacterial